MSGRWVATWVAVGVVGFAALVTATEPPEALVARQVAADEAPHSFLVRLCDDYGGRLTGSAANEQAMLALEHALRELGLEPRRDTFEMPGWERGADRVELLSPVARPLRVAALAYTAPHASFTAEVVDLGLGRPVDYPAEVAGRIGVVDARTPMGMRQLVATAEQQGVRGLLLLNRVNGGQLLARTSSFDGAPLPLPAFSITQEEGQWLQRLLARGQRPVVRVETHSRPRRVTTANLVVSLPGRSAERIVVGAHFDSWDLGQGAIDNGLGIAQLYALARALRGHSLGRTIELVWFNGEEQGLWGSRHHAARAARDGVVAMINLDMAGVPIAVNALGDDDLLPVLERWNAARGPEALAKGVENLAWFGSDHVPYQLAGIRALTFNAPIDPARVRYYHDMADTADKVDAELVGRSSAIIAALVVALAEAPDLPTTPRDPEATRELFQRFGLDRRMEAAGYVAPTP